MAVARALTLVYFLIAILTVASFASSALAAPSAKKAPQWEISEWINSDPISLSDLKGQVVVIDFFQLWCPGCKSFSIPLMHHWEQVFAKEAKEGRIAFISIHTVFEGHSFQSPKRLRRFLKEKGIEHPVGIDRHVDGQRVPETMRRYNTMGTPEMAIIDKQGKIRFQRFGFFEPAFGENLIRTLLDEQPTPKRAKLSR
ncbi:MAG: TlpA family protein disulfide reductase [Hyphomicrobiaceae bacterium]|nr:TlpA family protein disulfide reductase [Hyphomicrobiaceae bacterium]